MVKTRIPVQKDLSGKYFFERGYAVIIVIIIVNDVPKSTLVIVFLNPDNINGLATTRRYPSKVISFGMRDRPIVTEPPREDDKRYKNGYSIRRHTNTMKQ